MYGPGPGPASRTPQQPSTGALVALRVLFVAITVCTCGFGGWAATLRIAVVRRRTLDWVLFGFTLLVPMVVVLLIGSGDTNEPSDSDTYLVGVLFALAPLIVLYYLVVDIRHFSATSRPLIAPGPYASPVPPGATPPRPYGYGYPPGPANAPTHTPTHTPPPMAPPVTPDQSHPRIDQVRAELDELSDLLRKNPDQGHGPDGGSGSDTGQGGR
jgi:hypothetical protein